jgi:hypothetical protein
MNNPTDKETKDSSLISGKPTWDQLNEMHTKALGYIHEWRTRAETAEASLAAAQGRINVLDLAREENLRIANRLADSVIQQEATITAQAKEIERLRGALMEAQRSNIGQFGEPADCRIATILDKALTQPQPEGQSTEFTNKEIEGYFEKAEQPNAKVDEILANTPQTFTELLKQQPK